MHSRKVRGRVMLETTTSAVYSSPFSSATPVARPLRTWMRSTPEPVTISPPWSRRQAPIASAMAPMPPRAKPQAPAVPSTSPIAWCNST